MLLYPMITAMKQKNKIVLKHSLLWRHTGVLETSFKKSQDPTITWEQS